MDLTRQPPRRPSNVTMAGIVGLARMTDKARAANRGMLGEYVYGEASGSDMNVLNFLGISAAEFAEAVEKYDDAGISEWVLQKSGKNEGEIAAFNEAELSREPYDEMHRALLQERIEKYAPGRTDIKTGVQSIELDDWGNFYRLDLTEQPPRTPYCTDVAGIAWAARAADKARAANAGLLGEYNYGDDSEGEKPLLEFLGISAEDFARAAVNNPNDIELGDWVFQKSGKTEDEIADFNRSVSEAGPETDEERASFQEYLNELDPTRTDVTTWSALMLLDDQISFSK